ncbi:MAG: penicillin-insensitive murein endopeptidase [Myxococcota bacterium]
MHAARLARAVPLLLTLGCAFGGPTAAASVDAAGPGFYSGSGWWHAAAAEPAAELDDGTEASAKPARTWIKHKVVPRETLYTIADRYGVTRDAIIKWNKKKLGKKKWIYANQVLKIHARIVRPPREKITYVIQKRDTWPKIAKKFGIPTADLKAWNPKTKKRGLIAGKTLKVYTDPKAPKGSVAAGTPGGTESTEPLPEFHVRSGGIAVGKPNRGRLVNGVRLPASDMVKILDKDKVWGTSHTITLLQTALADFRRDSGYDKPLTVSSISRKGGGRFRPHKSHQTGRDVDIRLPRKSGTVKNSAPSSIDWTMTWYLVKSLVDTGEVEYIFVSWSRQKYLRRAAQSAGATKAELDKIIQYPRKAKTNKGVVRHSPGHDVHLHVRFTCTPGNTRCLTY